MNKILEHETAREALEAWDRGEVICTIEMGGLGPGYEQCIHIAAMEAIRAFVDQPGLILDEPDTDKMNDRLNQALWGNATVSALHLSGAQAGAAKNLAYNALKHGWRAMLGQVKQDRRIMVSRTFPGATA